MPASKPATLKTIAEKTGVSVSTVSLTLRDGSNVKPSTRALIEQAARELGYIPNRAGVRLRTGRTHVISLILSTHKNSFDYTRQLIYGIGTQINSSRYHLNVTPDIEPEDPLATVRYLLETRSADAAILTYTSIRDPRVQMLLDADFPFVCHGRTEFFTPHAYLDFNVERYIQESVKRLIAKKRRHIHLVAINNKTTNYTHIVNEFRKATAELGVVGTVTDNADELDTPAQVRDYARALPHTQRNFDAIITNNELTALALVKGLQDVNRNLQADYDLISKRSTDILPTLYPGIDLVEEDLIETGEELVRLTMQRINGESIDQLQVLQEPRFSWLSS